MQRAVVLTCGPPTISLTLWEVVRNINSQAPPRPLSWKIWGWTQLITDYIIIIRNLNKRGAKSDTQASQVAKVVKNLPVDAGDASLTPGSGKSPGGGHGNPLQYSCLEKPMDRGAWRATWWSRGSQRVRDDWSDLPHMHAKSDTHLNSIIQNDEITRHLMSSSYISALNWGVLYRYGTGWWAKFVKAERTGIGRGTFSRVTGVAKLEGRLNCIQEDIGVRNIELSRVRP